MGVCGVMKAVMGTRDRATMKPREKLIRAVQPSKTARYSRATSFSILQPCSVTCPCLEGESRQKPCLYLVLTLSIKCKPIWMVKPLK